MLPRAQSQLHVPVSSLATTGEPCRGSPSSINSPTSNNHFMCPSHSRSGGAWSTLSERCAMPTRTSRCPSNSSRKPNAARTADFWLMKLLLCPRPPRNPDLTPPMPWSRVPWCRRTDENTRFFAVPSTGAALLLVNDIDRPNVDPIRWSIISCDALTIDRPWTRTLVYDTR